MTEIEDELKEFIENKKGNIKKVLLINKYMKTLVNTYGKIKFWNRLFTKIENSSTNGYNSSHCSKEYITN